MECVWGEVKAQRKTSWMEWVCCRIVSVFSFEELVILKKAFTRLY